MNHFGLGRMWSIYQECTVYYFFLQFYNLWKYLGLAKTKYLKLMCKLEIPFQTPNSASFSGENRESLALYSKYLIDFMNGELC